MTRCAAVFGLLLLAAGSALTAEKERPNFTAVALPRAFGAIEPRLSSDGSKIAVSFQGAICRLPSDGGTLTRLTRGDGFDVEPVWSPDGARIAYIKSVDTRNGVLRVIDSRSGSFVSLPSSEQKVRGPL